MEDDISAIGKYQLNVDDNKVFISSSPEREFSKKAKYVYWFFVKVIGLCVTGTESFLEEESGLNPAPITCMN